MMNSEYPALASWTTWENPNCEDGFEVWRSNVAGDLPGGWSG